MFRQSSNQPPGKNKKLQAARGSLDRAFCSLSPRHTKTLSILFYITCMILYLFFAQTRNTFYILFFFLILQYLYDTKAFFSGVDPSVVTKD